MENEVFDPVLYRHKTTGKRIKIVRYRMMTDEWFDEDGNVIPHIWCDYEKVDFLQEVLNVVSEGI